MKVVNKTKKYLCLKIKRNEEFFIELGQVLGDELRIVKENNPMTMNCKSYYININESDVNINDIKGDFLLIDLETKRIQLIDNETFYNDYYILEEI